MTFENICPKCGSYNIQNEDTTVSFPPHDETVHAYYYFTCADCHHIFCVREPYVWTGEAFVENEE